MKPQIINIINFVRGLEPRYPELDLVGPVQKQTELLKSLGLPATFLLQYDALLRSDITGLFENTGFEIGIWLEIVKPLCEKAGVSWKGRPGFDCDWHANAVFTIAYTNAEREKLLDTVMADFRAIFGSYPKSAGCWFIDAHSLRYLSEKYGLDAFCNCRDQWGTDGYTLWGGYYGQGYYPSRFNAFIPAQSDEDKISVPVFRMLGSDPIYQYGAGLDENCNPCDWQHVKTLEPANEDAGGSPEWVNWFMKENFNGTCLSFGYAQAGQENSFGWDAMKSGIEYQFRLIADYTEKGKLSVQTLGDTGRWYRNQYNATPASSIAALSDWSDKGNRSVWYCSRYYRANVVWGGSGLFIRDLHVFNGNYRERYLDSVCESESCMYDSLPVMDGNRWSGNGVRAGAYPVYISGKRTDGAMECGEAEVIQREDGSLLITLPLLSGGEIKFLCHETTLSVKLSGTFDENSWALAFRAGNCSALPAFTIENNTVTYTHCEFSYSMRLKQGAASIGNDENIIVLTPHDQEIAMDFEQ